MLKSYLLTREGITEHPNIAEALALAGEENGILWVDMRSYDAAEVDQIAGIFKLHAVEVESLREEYTRPHVYEYEDHFHANFTYIDGVGQEPTAHELHVFLARNYIITASNSVGGELIDQVLDRYHNLPALVDRGTYYALYLLVDLLVDCYIHIADDIDDQVDDLEDEMSSHADRKTLGRLFMVKRSLFDIRRYLSPQRDLLNALARGGFAFLEETHEAYFQDVYNRMSRVFDVIDTSRDILSGTLDLYQSSVSNRLNDIMKILTIFAVILGIFSFITGYFGMNIFSDDLPKLHFWSATGWSAGLAVAITGGLVVWFRKKEWL